MEFKGKKLDIKTALEKLEKMSNKLEVGNQSLEENLKIYNEAMQLCLKCEEELKNAKQKISYYDEQNLEE